MSIQCGHCGKIEGPTDEAVLDILWFCETCRPQPKPAPFYTTVISNLSPLSWNLLDEIATSEVFDADVKGWRYLAAANLRAAGLVQPIGRQLYLTAAGEVLRDAIKNIMSLIPENNR
jgi:hypothetical protein